MSGASRNPNGAKNGFDELIEPDHLSFLERAVTL